MKIISVKNVLILILILMIGCTEKREDILERYPSGSKYVVGVYEGEGANEKLLERRYYQEDGTLGKIEDIKSDSVITFLDLNPNLLKKEGLKDYLEGRWYQLRKIEHNRFDVYQRSSYDFNDNRLEREYRLIICDGDDFLVTNHGVNSVSNIQYSDSLNLYEDNIRFTQIEFLHNWKDLLNRYDLKLIDFDISAYIKLTESRGRLQEMYHNLEQGNLENFDEATYLLGSAKLDRIVIRDNSIGTSAAFGLGRDVYHDDPITSNLYLDLFDDGYLIRSRIYSRSVGPYGCKHFKENYN